MTNVPKKNLHLLADMGFADSFAERLEAFNLRDRNHIILVGKSPHKRLAKGAFPYTNLKDEHAPNPDEYNKVIVHFLLPMVCHWLKQHRELRIHWMFYGAEVYRNPLVGYDPIGPETKRYFSLNLDDLKRNVGYHLIHRRAWKKALLQVESILTHNPVEFELIKSLVAVPQAKMETFFYGKESRRRRTQTPCCSTIQTRPTVGATRTLRLSLREPYGLPERMRTPGRG